MLLAFGVRRMRRPTLGRVVFAAWAVIAMAGLTKAANAADRLEIGVIKYAAGDATIGRAGGGSIVASVGASVFKDDKVLTGPGGAVGFILNDGSRFSVGPNSAIVVSDFKFEPAQGLFGLLARLLYGVMTFSSGDIGRLSPGSVKIESAYGAVSVRGTRFAIRQPKPLAKP